MQPVEIGLSASQVFEITYEDTAEFGGNPGVAVVSTRTLVDWAEVVSEALIRSYYENGEASVGAAVNVRHLAPSPVGKPLVVTSRVTATNGKFVDFAVEVRDGNMVTFAGTHTRAIVNLEKFMAGAGAAKT